MSAFADPNDDRKDPVNRMIQKLVALRNKALRDSKSMPRLTSHGNPICLDQGERDNELRKYANIRVIDNLISKLENIVS